MSEALDVQRISDEIAIRAVATRYTTALDTRDWSLLHQVFAADGTLTTGLFGEVEGPDAIAETLANVLEGLTTQHLLGNHAIEVSGDVATHVCYLHAQHVRPGHPGVDWYIIAGTYRDRLVRLPVGWRIANRVLDRTWTSGNPEAHAGGAVR